MITYLKVAPELRELKKLFGNGAHDDLLNKLNHLKNVYPKYKKDIILIRNGLDEIKFNGKNYSRDKFAYEEKIKVLVYKVLVLSKKSQAFSYHAPLCISYIRFYEIKYFVIKTAQNCSAWNSYKPRLQNEDTILAGKIGQSLAIIKNISKNSFKIVDENANDEAIKEALATQKKLYGEYQTYFNNDFIGSPKHVMLRGLKNIRLQV